MKKIKNSLVPEGAEFKIGSEPFYVSIDDIKAIQIITRKTYSFLEGVSSLHSTISKNNKVVKDASDLMKILYADIPSIYRNATKLVPSRMPVFMRLDLMKDLSSGNWMIAEIDPMNKHGFGFATACREAAGDMKSQKLFTLFKKIFEKRKCTKLCIALSRDEEFFYDEQCYFAEKLFSHTGVDVEVCFEDEDMLLSCIENKEYFFLDCPVFKGRERSEKIIEAYISHPDRFLTPPHHWMANKGVMSIPFEDRFKNLIGLFTSECSINDLSSFIPKTFTRKPATGNYVTKVTRSSGAKGVYIDEFYDGNKSVIYQEKVIQKKFRQGYVRLAVHAICGNIAELTITTDSHLPVHGGSSSVNYHVRCKNS